MLCLFGVVGLFVFGVVGGSCVVIILSLWYGRGLVCVGGGCWCRVYFMAVVGCYVSVVFLFGAVVGWFWGLVWWAGVFYLVCFGSSVVVLCGVVYVGGVLDLLEWLFVVGWVYCDFG